ncbi:MAG: hypothetical protein PHI06_15335, partial [Desulfobulbaceae bacterium]|nr:hypothetical protein [Desulfobulbaceae bacterium]
NEILPSWLPDQRWFRSKFRTITGVSVSDWTKMSGGFFVVFITVSFNEGNKESYCLPLKVISGPMAVKLANDVPESVIALFKTPKEDGVFLDGLIDRVACCDLFEAMADNRSFRTAQGGTLQAFATSAFDKAIPFDTPCNVVRLLGLEQSNSSVVLDEQAILKFYRQVEEGENPDFAISLQLTEHTHFTALAPVAGGILRKADGKTSAVAMLQPYLANDGDGWTYALHAAQEFLARSKDLTEKQFRPFANMAFLAAAAAYTQRENGDRLGDGFAAFETLGRRTAEFHLALAGSTRQPGFKPETMDTGYLQGLTDTFSHHASQTLADLSAALRDLPTDLQEIVNQVLAGGNQLINRFHDLSGMKGRATRIRCHGDYHLGQVIRRGVDWILLDFEGEPLRTMTERQEKHSPMKDVAGMLRSIAYAAMNTLLYQQHSTCEDVQLSIRLLAWEEWARAAFLHGYLDCAVGSSFLPANEKHLELLLHSFILDKAFYETRYELNNRPDWLRIPLQGILSFLTVQGER